MPDDLQALAAAECDALADVLDTLTTAEWDAPSLCAGWRIREVIAHVTMPGRLTPEQFGAEMAAAGGDFGVLSNRVAERDAALPTAELIAALRGDQMKGWAPPGGGSMGALTHVVIHGLDATVALGRRRTGPDEAARAVLDSLTAAGGRTFDVDLSDRRLVATDLDWQWGRGREAVAESDELIALAAHRTLPDGRTFAAAPA